MALDASALTPAEPTAIGKGYGLDRIYALPLSRGYRPVIEKVRVQIHRDCYDANSTYRVSAWRATGWVEVAAIPGQSDQVSWLPSYVAWSRGQPGQHEECVSGVETIATLLLDTAATVLRPWNEDAKQGCATD